MTKTLLQTLFILALAGFVGQVAWAQQTKIVQIGRAAKVQKSALDSYFDQSLAPFYHGVASGDPLEDRVILWTRITASQSSGIDVQWQIATNPQMTSIVNQGTVKTNAQKDYTVKVDAKGLRPATTYYYQFTALGKKSPVGRTRTTPGNDISQLKFAVVSCSNYQSGYFNAYGRLAERNDLDAIIHLGDYIYEYESGGYGYKDEIGRGHEPKNEMITLEDYRVRYSYYRLDPDLRNAHQQHAFITVWDDHEFANDAYKDGAQNHQSNEGSWLNRKKNAFKAYFEWMPIRQNTSEENRIYRKIKYGNLVDLILLDTRIEGRDKQGESEEEENILFESKEEAKAFHAKVAEITKNITSKKAKAEIIIREYLPRILNEASLNKEDFEYVVQELVTITLNKESTKKSQDKLVSLLSKSLKANHKASKSEKAVAKTILGKEQLTWFKQQLKDSQAKWKVIGNQVLFTPVTGFSSDDSWGGYTEERNEILEFVDENNLKNIAFITGDIHTTFACDVPLGRYSIFNRSNSRLVEFITPSITSDNADELAGGFLGGLGNGLLRLLNPQVREVNLSDHGYMILNVDQNRIQTDWFYIQNIKTSNDQQRYGQSWYVKNNETVLQEANSPVSTSVFYGPLAPKNTVKNQMETQTAEIVIVGNYPNPNRVEANLHYVLAKANQVKILIYNTAGELVKEVLNQKQEAGIYNVTFSTTDLQPGTYIYKVITNKEEVTKRMLIQR